MYVRPKLTFVSFFYVFFLHLPLINCQSGKWTISKDFILNFKIYFHKFFLKRLFKEKGKHQFKARCNQENNVMCDASQTTNYCNKVLMLIMLRNNKNLAKSGPVRVTLWLHRAIIVKKHWYAVVLIMIIIIGVVS